MSNGVKFPDIIKHENPNNAIVDLNDSRGFYFTDEKWTNFNKLDIAEDKRCISYLVSSYAGVYQYIGNSILDSDWNDNNKWRKIIDTPVGDYIKVFGTTDIITETCGSEETLVACSETGRIYVFVSDGTMFEESDDVIQTADGGTTRYVNIVIASMSNNFLLRDNNLSDVSNRQIAINNLTDANIGNAGKFLYVDTEGNAVYKEIGNPMQIKGRVDTYEDLPVEGVNIGDVYLVGAEGSQNFEEYVCTENDPIIKWENLGHVKYQSDWNQTNPLADDYIKNKPTGLMKFINEVETYDDLPSDAIVGSVYSIKEEVEVYDDITRESIGVYPPSTNFVRTETGWESLGGYIGLTESDLDEIFEE